MSRKNYTIALFLAAALCIPQARAADSPEFLWGAVLRSNDAQSASGTSSPNVIKANAAGELFSMGTFSSHATNAYKYAIYKRYEAGGVLTETTNTPVGALKETAGANNNLFLYKQDAQGNVLWQVTSNWGDVEGGYSQIAPTADGGVLLAAKVRFTASSTFSSDTLLQLIDGSGAKHAVRWTGSARNAYQIAAAKIGSNGQVQWIKRLIEVNDANINTTDNIRATGLEAIADGSFYLGGRYSDTIDIGKAGGGTQRFFPKNAGGDFLLLKLDPNGNFLWSLDATGSVAAHGVNSMTLHRNALYVYGNVKGDDAAAVSLQGHAIVPSAQDDNAYSARIDVGGSTPVVRWLRLLNARVQTNGKGGRIKVTSIGCDGGSVFLAGSFTGFIDTARGASILANDLTSGTAAAQLTAFIIRQNPHTGEVLGQVKDDSTGISETYAVALRGGTVHSYGYTMNVAAWYRTYNADFTGEAHHPLIAGGTAFGGMFLDSTFVALSRGRNATSIPGLTGGLATEAPPAFSSYFLSFAAGSLQQKSLLEQLENAIDSAAALNPLLYLPTSWEALQTAVAAAEAFLATGAVSEPEVSAALAAIRNAKKSVATYNTEFQWGGVVRSNSPNNTATPTTITQAVDVSVDGSSVFTIGNFTTQKGGADGSTKAVYKLYGTGSDTISTRFTPEGSLASSGNSSTNLLIHKLSRQDGSVQWQLTSDRGQVDAAYSKIEPTADGGLLLAIKVSFSNYAEDKSSDSVLLRLVENDGVTKHTLTRGGSQTNARQIAVAKIDADGHVLWIKHVIKVNDVSISNTTAGQAIDAIYVNGLEEDADGNFYLAGRYVKEITFATPGGGTKTLLPQNAAGWNGDSQEQRGDALLVKIDPDGNLLWSLEKSGTLYYQSVAAITLAGGKLFVAGGAQASAGRLGLDYFAMQGDTIFPTERSGGYVARFDVSSGTPVLQWFTALNARVQTNGKGGNVWLHNLDYDGGELFLTGRFTGFIDRADGTVIVANDAISGTSSTQRGYLMRLNPSTGSVSAAAMQGITGYYRAVFRENRVYAFGYTLMSSTFYHVYNPDLAAPSSRSLFSGGSATGWDAVFFDNQLVTVHRTRQANPFIAGLDTEHGLRKENPFAFSSYYTSHSMEGLQRQAENFREALEDTIRAVRIACADPAPYTADSWDTLQRALAAGERILAASLPVAMQPSQ
ncbi:MAG: hypothetical protein LBH84_05050, partial [Prevotellaceae bacterium]|nr:hypothetical protein [Prevotellaceae bacterium]